MKTLKPVKVEMGSHQVVHIIKMFGPLVVATIRAWVDVETCEWVIERQRADDPDIWVEYARVPGQIADEFDDRDDGESGF